MRCGIQAGVLSVIVAACAWGSAEAGSAGLLFPWLDAELRAIDRRLAAIEVEVRALPAPPRTPDGSRPGFIVTPRLPGREPPWVELRFPEPRAIDAVVLFPLVLRGSDEPVEGFGFPKRYRLVANATEPARRLVLAEETAADVPNPGLSPVVVRFPRCSVASVRLEVVKSWRDDVLSTLALAELMLLDGNRNVAVDAALRSNCPQRNPDICLENLVDMRTAVGLPAVEHEAASFGYQSRAERTGTVPKAVTIDLAEPGPIDEVRLVPVSREGPESFSSFGFPQQYEVHVSSTVDFADARQLRPSPHGVWPPGRNLVVLPCRDAGAFRYVRVTARVPWPHYVDFLFALAEIQVYRGDRNVALGCRVEATDATDEPGWSPEALTDGHAHRSRLLELPDWAEKIAMRQSLLGERAALLERRSVLRTRGEARAIWVGVAAAVAVMAALAGAATWQRRRLRREMQAVREQLARDLHDDIGSNLASIGLISRCLMDHGEPAGDLPAHVLEDVSEIGRIADESAAAMRDMVTMLAAHSRASRNDWSEVLVMMARRLLRGVRLRVDCGMAKRGIVPDLKTKREFYLFAKEAVTNIVKHSAASEVVFRIDVTSSAVLLEIQDDGSGFDPRAARGGFGLDNLAERARALRGSLSIQSTPGAGTTVRLLAPLRCRRALA